MLELKYDQHLDYKAYQAPHEDLTLLNQKSHIQLDNLGYGNQVSP
jgi:hypothetical protein